MFSTHNSTLYKIYSSFIIQYSINSNQYYSIMHRTVYLRTGDLITIQHQRLFLAIQSLTQSVPTLKDQIPNPIHGVFILTTQKCYERHLNEQKPLQSFKDDYIYYSEPILLYHLVSGKFLSYNKDIQNKATVELISSFKENCKFSIKPIFKCQTIITRKIRNEESVVICPAEIYNNEGNIFLVAVKGESKKGSEHSYILMKKNENSKFQLTRKTEPAFPANGVNNLNIYQLMNIQTRKNLYMAESPTKSKDMITFEKKINEISSFFDMRMKNSDYNSLQSPQMRIMYGVPIYLHSWKLNKYLSVNIIGDICLTEAPDQEAQFVIQSYSDLELNNESVVRIKHVSSSKYLSVSNVGLEVQLILQPRLIDTYMLVKIPIEDLRLNLFINDVHEIILQQLSEKKISYSNRQNIFKVLKQLINFIYGDEITISDFLQMKNKLNCRLSSNDQKLLANVGIINTLVKMCRIFIEEISKERDKKEFEQKDNTDEQIIIIYTMMSIIGICNRNPASTRILVQQMPLLYESLVSVSGIIESFYNLFKDSKELLLILENTSHKIGRKSVPSMELLINMLSGHSLDIPTKCKVLKLLQVLIIVNHRQKILGHEAILLKSLQENKLESVLLPIKSNDHQDLFVFIPQKKNFEQLQQLINSRRVYQKQLQLLKIQIELICSLCLNSNQHCFNYAKNIISQQMLYKYLKGNLQPDFKQIFMRYLIDVYLSNISLNRNLSSRSFVIFEKEGGKLKRQFSKIEESSIKDYLLTEGEEMAEISTKSHSHSKMIEDIQNFILDLTKKSIINEIIDSSFYMNLKSLRKFFHLRILDPDEVVQFRLLLIQYIAKFSRTSFKEEEKIKIVLEIIKIMTDYFNQHLQQISEEFIFMIKNQKIAENKLFQRFLDFASQQPFFMPEVQQKELQFLPKLIKESLEFNNIEIFLASSSLFKLVNERSSVFIQRLRQKIIIDSDWSFKFYNKASKLKRTLIVEVQNYMNSKSDQKEILYSEQQLNNLIKQINFLFYDNPNSESNQFSELAQNVFREMGFLQIIVNFLNQSQDRFKQGSKGNADIYATCFEFIGMYLQNNSINFNRFLDKYLDIKFVYQHQDRGQIKFLNHLIKMPDARDLLMEEIMDCILLSFQHNQQPNPYTILTLINAISHPHIDKERLQRIVEKMMKNLKIFEYILKITPHKNSYNFVWSHDPKSKNYHRDWILYCYLVLKFFLIILQQSTERTTLALQIQKFISISSLIDLLKSEDLITNTSMNCLEGSLLKNQVIKLFTKIYLPLLERERDQLENISSYVHYTLRILGLIKQSHEGANGQLLEQILMKSSEHGSIIFESQIRNKNQITIKEFQKFFNLIYTCIVRYLPFLLKILEKLNNSNPIIESNEAKKSEVNIYLDDSYRKMKDFIQYKLPYKQYNIYSKEYHSAIIGCEDLFKRKLGFNLSIEEEEEQDQVGEVEITDYFVNTKIQNTIKCFKYCSSSSERKIYESFLTIFHSSDFTRYLQEDISTFPIHFTQQELEKIMNMSAKYIVQNDEKMKKTVDLFYFFCQFNKKNYLSINLSNVKEQIAGILENEKEDPGNAKLCSFLTVSSNLLMYEIEQQEQYKNKAEIYYIYKRKFLERISKKIQSDKVLYSNSKISEQSVIYSQNGVLCFERINSNYTVELCLEWIRNIIIIAPLKIKENNYQMLFMQTVDLLKIYTTFMKQFNTKYISFELYKKVNLCLQIIFHFISGLSGKSPLINYLIERQIWNDFNLILKLDDGWLRNLDEIDNTQSEIFTKSIKNQPKMTSKIYLKQAEKLYDNSKKFYKQLITDQFYPLLPKKSLFGQAKSNVISIMKQLKSFPLEVKKQLFSRIEMQTINNNIVEVYRKHSRLLGQYRIPSVEIDIDFKEQNQWKQVAQNVCFQNGVDLTSLKMHIGAISGNNQLLAQYYNIRIEALTSKKIQSAFSSLWAFVKEFFLLFISCFLSLCKKSKNQSKKQNQVDEKRMASILNFFLTKIGRAEVTLDSELRSVDFLIRPQCTLNKQSKQKFIKKINFVSIQLKLESIYLQAVRYLLVFQNQIDFYKVFNKFAYLTFLTRNIQMLKYLNFGIIVAENMMLILNSKSNQQYFVDNSLTQPFVWLQIASVTVSASIMLAYCIKDLNLLIKQINFNLKLRSQSYGSNFNNYNAATKFFIKLSKVISNPTFAYHFMFTFIVCMVFYNKLFAALLMIDIFFQIPTLRNLMMSVWRSKIDLLLALIAFVLLQYFFSIFMFFNFKQQTLTYCQTLGACFGFVFVTTYKSVGGFVGYLFEKGGSQIQPINFFEVFQDIYVVLIFQIFFALILAIIIDTFSTIRSEQSTRQEYLNSCCITCNLQKGKFNSSLMNFKSHIAITHNIWNYFYYYQYIFHKPAIKRTTYQRQIFLIKSCAWLPISQSFDVVEEAKSVQNEK